MYCTEACKSILCGENKLSIFNNRSYVITVSYSRILWLVLINRFLTIRVLVAVDILINIRYKIIIAFNLAAWGIKVEELYLLTCAFLSWPHAFHDFRYCLLYKYFTVHFFLLIQQYISSQYHFDLLKMPLQSSMIPSRSAIHM